MKKCQVCGEPIAVHKEVKYPFRLDESYQCQKCKSEYVFSDHVMHYVLLCFIFFVIDVSLRYLIVYRLAQELIVMFFCICIVYIAHLWLRSYGIFSSMKINTEPSNITEEQNKPESIDK